MTSLAESTKRHQYRWQTYGLSNDQKLVHAGPRNQKRYTMREAWKDQYSWLRWCLWRHGRLVSIPGWLFWCSIRSTAHRRLPGRCCMNVSQREIERWTDILQRNYMGEGIDRLRRYVCSMGLGRDFGQSVEEHIENRKLTEFIAWSRKQS